ncbi:hypothetical protein QTP70_003074, partial [Hemibagrus guttatus]
TTASARISVCLADISSWMTAHQLKLNPSKTELLIIPVAARIGFKTLMLAYKAKNGPAPSYLKALVTPRTAPRSLRSTSTARLVPPSLREKALIDLGAAVNLIDGALAERLGISTFPCLPPLRITAIDSHPIGEGYLKRQTELLNFRVGLFHHERLAFYVTSSPANPVILGFLWLRHHDNPNFLALGGAGMLEYTEFREVFSEVRAARLPAHQPWDCAIDLLPNASLPRGRVYPLSLPESKAMEEYIETALAAGHIRPSTSPAAAGFFFVGKKDGGLCPCIDYWGLNAITVPYPYPLPLVPAVLEQLRGARIFSKLDLRSAYNLVRIKEGESGRPLSTPLMDTMSTG